MPENWQTAGFGLYVHWPFCKAKCPYCDFNSHVRQETDHPRWMRAYLSEMKRVSEQTPGRVLTSIYIGGGTPSLMPEDLVESLLGMAAECWVFSNNIEITIEANPTSSDARRFTGYRAAGVNRMSVGIQALNDDDLRALGRQHTAREAQQAFETARQTFPRVSLDLIYARQNQSLMQWKTELERALEMAAGHLSLYQLTIERGTAFGDRMARGRLPGLPNEDLAADMYLLTQDLCTRAGLPAYEISNHAAADAYSRHNLIYWRGGDYAGIGPGAHGRLSAGKTRYRTRAASSPSVWLEKVDTEGNGDVERQAMSPAEIAAEYMMMGLRLTEGISVSRLSRWSDVEKFSSSINWLESIDMLHQTGDRLMLTQKGRPLLNAVLRELLP